MIFDKLSHDDKITIEQYINVYARPSEGEINKEFASLRHILRYWDKNKENLYHLFGDKFILEKEVTLEMPLAELESKMDSEMRNNEKMYVFYHNFNDFIYAHRKELGEDCYWYLPELFGVRDLTNNKYDGRTFTVNYGDKKVVIQNGCKPVKMLGKLAELFNIEGYEDFRLNQSLVTNQRKLKGTLCLSIHPLDYMTMSDNDSGWTSCMNWRELGCYCRGTVEMMNSESVVVAYLKSNENFDLFNNGSEYWTNKKWRTLAIVTNDFITTVKGYPYQSKELSTYVVDWLKELELKNNNNEFYDVVKCYEYDELLNFDDLSVRFDFDTYTMYNDFGACNHYATISLNYANSVSHDCKQIIYYNYSGPEECMVCGSTNTEFGSEGELVCADCQDVRYCASCGCTIYGDVENGYELDGELMCEDCYYEHRMIDPFTDDDHNESNMVPLYFLPNKVSETDKTKLVDGTSFEIYSAPSLYVYIDSNRMPSCVSRYIGNETGDYRCFYANAWGAVRYYVTLSDISSISDIVEIFNTYSVGWHYRDEAEFVDSVNNCVVSKGE